MKKVQLTRRDLYILLGVAALEGKQTTDSPDAISRSLLDVIDRQGHRGHIEQITEVVQFECRA